VNFYPPTGGTGCDGCSRFRELVQPLPDKYTVLLPPLLAGPRPRRWLPYSLVL